jgi:hypothetical protein
MTGDHHPNGDWRQAHDDAVAKMPTLIQVAHKHSSRHASEIRASSTCGCFYCLTVFSPGEITEWVDDEETAICPKCGIDSVIGSASGIPLTHEFLAEMKSHWF